MTEPEENKEEFETPEAEMPEAETPATEAEEEEGTVIRDTDIVFDCPHCGHNLAIDYRGAGLQIECVNCGESVLVPIRNLQRAEARIEELELELRGVTMRRDTLRALLESFAVQLEEMKELARNEMKLRDKSSALVNRLAGDIAATIGNAAHGEMEDEEAVENAE